jgi:hypothetical protein
MENQKEQQLLSIDPRNMHFNSAILPGHEVGENVNLLISGGNFKSVAYISIEQANKALKEVQETKNKEIEALKSELEEFKSFIAEQTEESNPEDLEIKPDELTE